MFAVTKHYAKQAIKDGYSLIHLIKTNHTQYLTKAKVLDDVKQNMHVMPKIAKTDQQNFANYNLQKLLRAGFSLHFSKFDNKWDTAGQFEIGRFLRNKQAWCHLMNYGCGDNYIIHMGKHYAITATKHYSVKPIGDSIYLNCSTSSKYSAHKSTLMDLQDTVRYLNRYFCKVIGYYNNLVKPLYTKINYIKRYGLTEHQHCTNLQMLHMIKADCIAMKLHQKITKRFSKTEHRYLQQDFLKFNELFTNNKNIRTIMKFMGVSSLSKAIFLNQTKAPTQSSYTHMISSFDVAKTHRDAKILSRLKHQHIQFVQNNTTDIDSPQPYNDDGIASDNTHSVKPLQPAMLVRLIEASRDPNIAKDYI